MSSRCWKCAQTGGPIFAVETRMPPGGGPPIMHRHEPGEIYHVLSGEFSGALPGAPMEGFIRAAAALAAGGAEPSMADVLDLAHRHGIEMLGPYAEVSAAP
ncbi:cupin domain-containing protein [Jiangella alkaliphila]|nr:hypothetical protein [Jiangella alkaliphila]